ARHDVNPGWSLRAAARRLGNLPQSRCESRAGDVSLTRDMTLTRAGHCEPPQGGAAISRKTRAGRKNRQGLAILRNIFRTNIPYF
ncbi:MAG: hypothetical protein AB1457_16650, partial [Chloroflexota bacterium]